MPSALALYVHIPFCLSKCPYCDFNTYAGIEPLTPSYVGALEREIALWGDWLGRPALSSVFFGGGTPSYLPTRDLARLMRAVASAFGVSGDIEATIEANPGDCSRERVQAMRGAGFNRISIGAQSFDDHELRLLGRRHSADRAAQAVDAARAAGFDNVSIDLMFGLPNQYLSAWAHSLEQAAAIGATHISAYALTLEPGTPLEADVRRGRIPEPDADLAAEMYALARSALADAGFAHYEISNWAQPGRESAHNLAYWRCLPYLGVGPGTHSYLYGVGDTGALGVRFATVKSPRGHIDRVAGWAPEGSAALSGIAAIAGEWEEIDRSTAMADAMMMGLRLNSGVADADFRARFGVGVADAFPRAEAECVELGLLEWADGALRLTDAGRPLANEAFVKFVAR